MQSINFQISEQLNYCISKYKIGYAFEENPAIDIKIF